MPLIQFLNFQAHAGDKSTLVAVQSHQDLPFDIKRVYYIYGVQPGEHRGFHAHKTLSQALVCLTGGVTMKMDDGLRAESVRLAHPQNALLIRPLIWHEMYDFQPGTVLLTFASDFYDEEDYLRDYQAFLQYLKEVKS